MVIFTLLVLVPAIWILSVLPLLLAWLGAAVTVAAWVLLVVNGVFLALLLVARRWLVGRGYFDEAYWETLGDWRGMALRIGRAVLMAGIVWESLVVAACTVVLLLRPAAWFL